MSLFNKFLEVSSIDYYAKQVASKLGFEIFTYYWDNINYVRINKNNHIRNWDCFKSYPDYRLRFNLTKPSTISKIGLENYILDTQELRFNLTIKGYSILYIVKFYVPDVSNKPVDINNNILNDINITQEQDGQLVFTCK